ncbi:MAG: DUF3368 domain-containing protein [Okeania sp. SIO3C4]|nr:DUF3368 domain-containing protein [Okeania sp. SIO3B3]NER04362.1 DUF3368 domain-containing protein [Okeania sp. SIO3C4]
MIVVSDTSPICYLLLIGEIKLLPQLYGQVLIPRIVQQELSDERSPIAVKNWIEKPPQWLIIQDVTVPVDKDLEPLDAGEKAAIILALQERANLIIIDETLGRKVARNKGLRVISCSVEYLHFGGRKAEGSGSCLRSIP